MNRYYRPSAPRYTSQFVEDRYPEDLILQSGMMKYQERQEAVKQFGEFSALSNLLQPGYRTHNVAGEVKNDFNNRLNDFMTRHEKDYDSPQAMMELQRMRYEWLSDPRVQLVKQDFEQGNEQYDKMRAASKTYPLDFDPNVHPVTREIKQFNSGDRYSPYQNLTTYQDVPQRIVSELEVIKPELREKVPVRVRVPDPANPGQTIVVEREGTAEVRDMNMMQGTLDNLKKRLFQGNEDWSAYALTQFRDQYGNLRKPTDKEVDQMLIPIAERMVVNRQTGNTTWKEDTTSGSGSGKGKQEQSLSEKHPLEWVPQPKEWNTLGNNELRQMRLDARMAEKAGRNYEVKDARIKSVIELMKKSNPQIANMSVREQLDKAHDYINENRNKSYSIAIQSLGKDLSNAYVQDIAGDIDEKGYMTKTGAGSFIRGAKVWDYDNGKEIQNVKEKSAFTKEDGQLRVLGIANDQSIARQPFPGGIAMESTAGGDNRRILVQSESLKEQQKPWWNLYAFDRSTADGVGNVSALELSTSQNGIIENWKDVSDRDMNWDEKNVSTSSGLYIRPVKDLTNGEVKVKVYAKNPAKEGNEDSMLKEYSLGDYKSMDDLKTNLLVDAYGLDRNNIDAPVSKENSLIYKAIQMRKK